MNQIETQNAGSWADGSLWLIVVFVGAFALIAAMAWARRKNAAITPEENRRTEQATRALYREQDAEDKARDR